MFGNIFKILCSLPWIQGSVPENAKPPLPTKYFFRSNQDQILHWTLCPHWYCSDAKPCLTLSDYMFGNKTGLPVFHYFVEFPQAHVV